MQTAGSTELRHAPDGLAAVLLRSNCQLGSDLSSAINSYLIPTIQQLRRNEALHVAFAMEGLLLEQLEANYPDQLRQLQVLAKSKQAEFIVTPHYRPQSTLCDTASLERQLKLNRDSLETLGLTPSNIAYLNAQLYRYLQDSELKFSAILLETDDEDLLSKLKQTHLVFQKNNSEISLQAIAPNQELAPEQLESISCQRLTNSCKQLTAFKPIILPQESIPETIFHQDLLLEHHRLCANFAQLKSETANLSGKETVKQRIDSISNFIARLQHQSVWQQGNETIPSLRLAAYNALISADVEIEALRFPDVDPNDGWARLLEHTPTANLYTIETQLMRMTLSSKSHGGLISCHYKPRKINLCNVLCDTDHQYSFTTSLIEKPEILGQLLQLAPTPPAQEITYLKNRRTSGLVGIRLTKTFSQHSTVKLIEDYTVRSGLGAYANNSTTGWSFEHWLEGNPGDTMLLRIDFHFLLATPIPHAISTRALTIASAEAEHAAFLDRPHLLQASEVTGGLHGIRLIDGVNNFTIDLRSGKPLLAATVVPQIETEILQGIKTSFYLPAKNLQEDNHSNTIYVSIP